MPQDFDNGELSEDLKQAILNWCHEIINARLGNSRPKTLDLGNRLGAVFVTLEKGGQLRGCIGNFNFESPLADSISSMTQAAAFKDPRFSPLTLPELGDLDITVSILTPPRSLSSLDDLVIGRDGLYLVHPYGRGVLLPVVAAERGWTPLEFARQTSRKAGLHPEAWSEPEADLRVFMAPAFSTNQFKK